MTDSTVLAAHTWPTNAELIADVARLYFRPDDRVLDLTYGKGVWWNRYQPEFLTAFMPRKDWTGRTVTRFAEREGWAAALDVNYLDEFPVELHGAFDVVAFDPPYVAKGGRTTGTIDDMDDRFGLQETPATPIELHNANMDGLQQAISCCRPGGFVLLKCMDYVSSGKVQPAATEWALEFIREELPSSVTRDATFYHVGDAGPQPLTDKCRTCNGAGTLDDSVPLPEFGDPCEDCDGKGKKERRQVHPRNNMSILYVLRKRGRRARRAR